MRIGIFDSGIGGLTVVKELFKLVPGVEIFYFADTLNMPYGNKKKEEIMECASKIVRFLTLYNPELIISACGTVSSVLDDMHMSNKIIGVINSSCYAASEVTKNGNIGVIATSFSIESRQYSKCLLEIDKKFKVFSESCPSLAGIIEDGDIRKEDSEIVEYMNLHVKSLKEHNIDTLILGCTHYPVFKSLISKIFKGVSIVDSGLETAKYVAEILNDKFRDRVLSEISGKNKLKIFVTQKRENFVLNASNLVGFDVSRDVVFVCL